MNNSPQFPKKYRDFHPWHLKLDNPSSAHVVKFFSDKKDSLDGEKVLVNMMSENLDFKIGYYDVKESEMFPEDKAYHEVLIRRFRLPVATLATMRKHNLDEKQIENKILEALSTKSTFKYNFIVNKGKEKINLEEVSNKKIKKLMSKNISDLFLNKKNKVNSQLLQISRPWTAKDAKNEKWYTRFYKLFSKVFKKKKHTIYRTWWERLLEKFFHYDATRKVAGAYTFAYKFEDTEFNRDAALQAINKDIKNILKNDKIYPVGFLLRPYIMPFINIDGTGKPISCLYCMVHLDIDVNRYVPEDEKYISDGVGYIYPDEEEKKRIEEMLRTYNDTNIKNLYDREPYKEDQSMIKDYVMSFDGEKLVVDEQEFMNVDGTKMTTEFYDHNFQAADEETQKRIEEKNKKVLEMVSEKSD